MALNAIDLKKLGILLDKKINNLRGETANLFDEKIDGLRQEIFNWKSEFFTKIDPILKEVVANREERTVISARLKENSEDIRKLKGKVFGNISK